MHVRIFCAVLLVAACAPGVSGGIGDGIIPDMKLPGAVSGMKLPDVGDLIASLETAVRGAVESISQAADRLSQKTAEAANSFHDIAEASAESVTNASQLVGSATAALSDMKDSVSESVSSAIEKSSAGMGEMVESARASASSVTDLASRVETAVGGVAGAVSERLGALIDAAVQRIAEITQKLPESTALAVVSSPGVATAVSSNAVSALAGAALSSSAADALAGAAVTVGARVVNHTADTLWHNYHYEIVAAGAVVATLALIPVVGILVICSMLCATSRRLSRIELAMREK